MNRSEPVVLVLLCGDLVGHRLDPHTLARQVMADAPAVTARVVPGLCAHLHRVTSAVRAATPRALVLALCERWQAQGEPEGYARRAGLSPLAVQVVPLGTLAGNDPSPMEKARALLSGAVARARALPPLTPEHIRPVPLGRGGRVGRRALLTLPPLTYQPVPVVEHGRCAAAQGCRICVAACPHRALAAIDDVVRVRRDACTACGRCLTACPREAIQMPGWSQAETAAQVTAALTHAPHRPLVWQCDRRPPSGGAWLPVPVSCAGAVTVAMLLQPLLLGAPAVALAHCGDGCRSGTGMAGTVEDRVAFCRALLAAMGQSPERVRLARATEELPVVDLPPLSAPVTPPAAGEPEGTARLITELVSVTAAPPLRLEHAASPLGEAVVDPAACTLCGSCAATCPTGALEYGEDDAGLTLRFDPRRCVACGQCVPACPERERGAIRVHAVTDTTLLNGGTRTVVRDAIVRCRRCGGPVASQAMLRRIADLLGSAFRPEVMAERCADCRGLP
mgnify:CR=1 FL=1